MDLNSRLMRAGRQSAPALLVLFLLILPRSAGAAPAIDPETRAEPADSLSVAPPDTEHLVVQVGIYILNLVSLDEVEQTFSCTGYLTETWTDSRLAFTPKPGEPQVRYYQRQNIWFPLLQFDNSTVARTLSGYILTGTAEGNMRYIEKFSVRLSSNMYLRSFPFDAEDLEIYVHPFTGQVKRIFLSVDPDATGISQASYTPLPLWKTGKVKYDTVMAPMSAGSQVVSHVVFRIHVVRHSQYYLFRIFVPLFLMVAISWGVLWIPPSDLNSQLMISVTTVLTLVAFSVAVSNVLPPVPYLTFYDSFFLVSFFFIMLSIAEILVIHSVHGQNLTSAVKLRHLTRRVLPGLYIFSLVLMALIFFR